MNRRLMDGIRFFTRETEILSGLSVACGRGERTVTAMDGEVSGRSVFDLASATKLSTGLCAMKLRDRTVGELMTFAVTVRTPVRLDACPDRESALETLFAAEGLPQQERRAYSDIPAMVIKYILEAAGGIPFFECVRKIILEPAGMTETWAAVPAERTGDCQVYDREHRIETGRYILRAGLKQTGRGVRIAA